VESYVLAVAVALAFLNALASMGAILSSAYARDQKAMQLALVWLVPILGVLLVWSFLHENGHIRKVASRTEGSLTTPNYDFAPGDSGGGHGGQGGV